MTSLMDDFLDSVVYDEPVVNWNIPATREDPDDDWVEKALRDAVLAVKHLPTQHDQQTHAGESGRKENKIVGEIRGVGPIYEINDWDTLPKDDQIAILYNPTTGKLWSTDRGAMHADMVDVIDKRPGTDKYDEYTRLDYNPKSHRTMNVAPLIRGDASSGGAVNRLGYPDEEKGMKNLYRALDKLFSVGAPASMNTLIISAEGGETEGTLKSLVEKAGTVEGAKKAWLIRRRRQIEDLRARAVATRDARLLVRANAMAQSMARLQQASLVAKHLALQHDQRTHGHGRTSVQAIPVAPQSEAVKAFEDAVETRQTLEAGYQAVIAKDIGYDDIETEGLAGTQEEVKDAVREASNSIFGVPLDDLDHEVRQYDKRLYEGLPEELEYNELIGRRSMTKERYEELIKEYPQHSALLKRMYMNNSLIHSVETANYAFESARRAGNESFVAMAKGEILAVVAMNDEPIDLVREEKRKAAMEIGRERDTIFAGVRQTAEGLAESQKIRTWLVDEGYVRADADEEDFGYELKTSIEDKPTAFMKAMLYDADTLGLTSDQVDTLKSHVAEYTSLVDWSRKRLAEAEASAPRVFGMEYMGVAPAFNHYLLRLMGHKGLKVGTLAAEKLARHVFKTYLDRGAAGITFSPASDEVERLYRMLGAVRNPYNAGGSLFLSANVLRKFLEKPLPTWKALLDEDEMSLFEYPNLAVPKDAVEKSEPYTVEKTFEGHKGRKGRRGGSVARGAAEFEGYDTGDKKAASDWGREHNRQRSSKDDDLFVLSQYVQNTHYHINTSLRRGKEWKGADTSNMISDLDDLLDGREIKSSVIVWRGVDEFFFKTLKPGKRFKDKAFVSTTLVQSIVEPNRGGSYDRPFDTVMKIIVPKGIKAYYVGTVGSGYHPNEFEFLLQRGLTFEVQKVDKDNLTAVLKVVKP